MRRRLTHTPRKTSGRGWTLDNVGLTFFHEKTVKKPIFPKPCSPLKNPDFKCKIGVFDQKKAYFSVERPNYRGNKYYLTLKTLF